MSTDDPKAFWKIKREESFADLLKTPDDPQAVCRILLVSIPLAMQRQILAAYNVYARQHNERIDKMEFTAEAKCDGVDG